MTGTITAGTQVRYLDPGSHRWRFGRYVITNPDGTIVVALGKDTVTLPAGTQLCTRLQAAARTAAPLAGGLVTGLTIVAILAPRMAGW